MSNPIAEIQSQIESTMARSFAAVVEVVHEDGLAMGLNAKGGMVWAMGSDAYAKFVEQLSHDMAVAIVGEEQAK